MAQLYQTLFGSKTTFPKVIQGNTSNENTIVFENEKSFTKFFVDAKTRKDTLIRELIGNKLAYKIDDTKQYIQNISKYGVASDIDNYNNYKALADKNKKLTGQSLYITTDRINGVPLSTWLTNKGDAIEVEVIRKFAFQLIFVMAKCHIVYGLQHNDIHVDNIFVTQVQKRESLYFTIDGGKDKFQIDLDVDDLKIVLLDFGSASVNVNDDVNNPNIIWRTPNGECLQNSKAIEYILAEIYVDDKDIKHEHIMQPETEMFTIGHILMTMSAHYRWPVYIYKDQNSPAHFCDMFESYSPFRIFASNEPKGQKIVGTFIDTDPRFGAEGSREAEISVLEFYYRMKALKEIVFEDTGDISKNKVFYRNENNVIMEQTNTDIKIFNKLGLAKDGNKTKLAKAADQYFEGLRDALKDAKTHAIIKKLMKFNSVERANFGLPQSENNTYCLLLPLYHHYFGKFKVDAINNSSGTAVFSIDSFAKPAKYNEKYDLKPLREQELKIEIAFLDAINIDSDDKKKELTDLSKSKEQKAKEEADKKAKEEADKKTKEEADKKAKEEADKKTKETADAETTRKAKEAADAAKQKSTSSADDKVLEECKTFLLDQMDPQHIIDGELFYVTKDPKKVLEGADKCLKYIADNINKIQDKDSRENIRDAIITVNNKAKAEEMGEDATQYFLYSQVKVGKAFVFEHWSMAVNAAKLAFALYLIYKKTDTTEQYKLDDLNVIGGNPNAKGADRVQLIENILKTDLPREVVEFLGYKEKNKPAVVQTDQQDHINNYKDKLREFILLLQLGLFQPSSLTSKKPAFVKRTDVFNNNLGFTELNVNEKMKVINELYKKIIDAMDEAKNIKVLLSEKTKDQYFDANADPFNKYSQFSFLPEDETHNKIIYLINWVYVVHLRVVKNIKTKDEWTKFKQNLNISIGGSAKEIYNGIQKMLEEVVAE